MADKEGTRGWLRLLPAVAAGVIVALTLRGRIAGILLPLLLAYVGARAVRPTAKLLSKACRISERTGGAVLATVICGGVIYGVVMASGRLAQQLWRLADELPEYAEEASSLLRRLYEAFPISSGGAVEILESIIKEAAGYLGAEMAELLGGAVQSFPGIITGTLVGTVGFIYLTADMDGAARSIESLLPERYSDRIVSVFLDISGAVFSYLRAYGTIMAVNFLLISAGLGVIGAKNPLAAGAIIAFVDALPVFGCGTVLIPWAVWSFLAGRMLRGAGLLILLGIIYIVRQVLEPRLIGKMTGVHPFVALAAVYAGLKLGGVGGMIASPIVLMCIRAGRESGGAGVKNESGRGS